MKVKLVLMSALVLAGCSEKYGDLHEWMNQTRADAKTKVRPAEPPAPLEPVTYFAPQQSGPNAYSMQRMKAAFQNGSAPNLNRTKELLENYSLENLRYVGSIGSKNALSALIEVDVNGQPHVYTVRPGNYLGQNFGRITKITADRLGIVETVEDTFGNWVNRDAELTLTIDGAPTSTPTDAGK